MLEKDFLTRSPLWSFGDCEPDCHRLRLLFLLSHMQE